MVTTNERVDELMANLPYVRKTAGVDVFRERLRQSILEAMRDQRHACAEAVLATGTTHHLIDKCDAHQRVMNATVTETRKAS